MAITRLKKKHQKTIQKAKQRKKRVKQLLATPIIKHSSVKKPDKDPQPSLEPSEPISA